jgi:hypothetical protein
MSTRLQRRVVPKSASYTIVAPMDAPGTTFTNKGAVGAIVFTLPAAIRSLLGYHYRFRPVVDQTITVQPPVADTALALNDAAADSVALSTGGQKLGGLIEAECVEVTDGVFQWAISGLAVGHTYTVAT